MLQFAVNLNIKYIIIVDKIYYYNNRVNDALLQSQCAVIEYNQAAVDTVQVLDNIRTNDDKIITILFNTATTWYEIPAIITSLTNTENPRDDTIDITRLCYTV